MHLREGGFYIDREGRKRGPVKHRPDVPLLPWIIHEATKTLSWSQTGCWYADGRESPFDLVGEWVEPVKDVPIDLVPLSHYRRGVAKLFDMGRLY